MKLLVARIIVGICFLSGLVMLGAILWLYWLPIIVVSGMMAILFGVPVAVVWAFDTIEKHQHERGNHLWIRTKKN